MCSCLLQNISYSVAHANPFKNYLIRIKNYFDKVVIPRISTVHLLGTIMSAAIISDYFAVLST